MASGAAKNGTLEQKRLFHTSMTFSRSRSQNMLVYSIRVSGVAGSLIIVLFRAADLGALTRALTRHN